jgi:pimeloyl-ACP methyl ester carboxylesterase
MVGHSFGSMIGTLMAKARPDLFYAYVGTGQVADSKEGNVVGYRLSLREAQSVGDAQAVADLKAVGPPPIKTARDGSCSTSGEWFGKVAT